MPLTKDTAETLAQKFRTDNGLGSSDAIKVKSLLLRNNILTVYRPMSEKAYGLSLRSPKGDRFILVNSNNPIGRQYFTIAHELYHLYYEEHLCPHLCEADGSTREEKDADMFAAALLMPYNGVLQMLPQDAIKGKKISTAMVLRLEQYFQVSHQAMVLRLKKLGLISESELTELMHLPVANTAQLYGYDTALYEGGNHNLVIGDYGELAYALFEREKISESHYEELIKLIKNGQN